MQPTAYPIRQEIIKAFWESFVETGQVEAIEGYEPDPAIILSWQRCSLRFSPHAKPKPMLRELSGLTETFKAHTHLVETAILYLEDIYQFVEGSNCAIMLADGAGCILALTGDSSMVDQLSQSNYGVGAYWAEGYLGTNALGLTLITTMPTQVVGAEHYFEAHHDYASSAAPIHNVVGRIIGLLGIVTPAKTATSHTLALAMSTARAITNQLHTNLYFEETNYHLSEVKAILEGISVGVLTCNYQGFINQINAQAAAILGLDAAVVMGEPLAEVLELPDIVRHPLEKAQHLDDTEINLQIDSRSVPVSLSLRPIHDGSNHTNGMIIMLRPIEDVRQLVYRQLATEAKFYFHDMPVNSDVIKGVLRQARMAARGLAPVLLQGEGGVGKNHLARAIHDESRQATKPFISINCRAIPYEMITSEFLGYDESHPDSRPSKFELAHGGTLLIDQIDKMSIEVQNALLNVIETKTVTRLGSTRPITVDVRIIATTMENLEELVNKGQFLADLFFRFGVFNITIPPLRERREDIPMLAENFLKRLTDHFPADEAIQIEDEAVDVLKRYPWPGNVRELESVLESAFYKCQDSLIRLGDLPENVRMGRVILDDKTAAYPVISVAEAEREAILRAGWAYQGRIGEMAAMLGMGRTTLWRKMKQMNITTDYFKQ